MHSFENLCMFYNKEVEHTHRQYKFYCITIIQFLLKTLEALHYFYLAVSAFYIYKSGMAGEEMGLY